MATFDYIQVSYPLNHLSSLQFQFIQGVKTSENKYSSPIISLHTYNKAQKVIIRTTKDVTIAGSNPSNPSASHQGPSSSTNTDRQEIEEKVLCIPVEDIISVSYSADVKKEYQTFETTQERPRAPKAKLGCCGRMKQCLRETFCCCPACLCKVCKPLPVEQPQYDTNQIRNVTATRMILIEMKCIRHTNIHIPSHVQVLSSEKRLKFYEDKFLVDPIEFYLVNNSEAEGENFEAKRNEAEDLSRVVVQLRNMVFEFFYLHRTDFIFLGWPLSISNRIG